VGECNNQAVFPKLSYFPVSLLFFFFLLDIFFIYISNAIPKVPYTLPPFFNSLVQRGDWALHEAEFHAAVGTDLFPVWQGIEGFVHCLSDT
jgi:hypothetical protein